ncbi:MAG TPA: hypothetical protein VGE63_02165 [Candidatus Paceibacterota bacterium]
MEIKNQRQSDSKNFWKPFAIILVIVFGLFVVLPYFLGTSYNEASKSDSLAIAKEVKRFVLDSVEQKVCDSIVILYPEKVAFGEYSFQAASKPNYDQIGSCEITFNYKGKKVSYVLRVTNMEEVLNNHDGPLNGINDIDRFKNRLRELGKSQINNIEITAKALPNGKLDITKVSTLRGEKIIWKTQGISFE